MTDCEELNLLKQEVLKASSREALDSCFKKWREENLLPLRKKLQNTSDKEEKRRIGLLFKELKESSQKIYQLKKEELSSWKNISCEPRKSFRIEKKEVDYESVNYLSEVMERVSNFIEKYNFDYLEESEIVRVSDNFDSLLIPENHPARATSDSFFLTSSGKKKLSEEFMLRTHNTTSTLKILEKFKGVNFKGASFGTVYRKEDNDPTHLSQFTQLDLVWVNKNLSIEELRELIEALLEELFKGFEWKKIYCLRPSYFPFTSPSFEVDLMCLCKGDEDCRLCKGTRWIEILGCGFLRSEILEKTHPNCCALALGLGIERICMIQNLILDIRSLYENNFKSIVKEK
ncbi:tRNA ligase subunit PheS family protein [Mycoplasma suis]|uniref:phenylalanine--tRNA ligase n=2 Tax=Mycoplasma suis TaxID=57372 RepID=F0QQ57_MYCSL|nr:phenylalanine--tRNA ligase subunit alpha [Mycoplasma suis]ADX97627.1 phenylalanyl-tRNA synthetase, alpha subunit [Mycoplasma suis str. Illinois]CBZ40162.1 Phenylalanyl-tRNA synthetase, alpha subunit [Mycoplasma suis KI3806]